MSDAPAKVFELDWCTECGGGADLLCDHEGHVHGPRRAVLFPEGADDQEALILAAMDAVPGLYHEPVIAIAKAWGLISEGDDTDEA